MWHATLRSETSKLLSYRWCQLGLIAAVFIAPFVLLCSESYKGIEKQTVIIAVLQMLYLGQIGAVILGATIFGQEYTHSALRTSLLAVPARERLFMGKIITLSASVIITGVLSALLCLGCLMLKNGVAMSGDLLYEVMVFVIPVIISGLELALISAGLSIVVQSLVIPIAVLFSMILGLSQMIFSVVEGMKITPVMATLNLFLLSTNEVLLDRGIGILVQLVWAIALILIAFGLFTKRDVR